MVTGHYWLFFLSLSTLRLIVHATSKDDLTYKGKLGPKSERRYTSCPFSNDLGDYFVRQRMPTDKYKMGFSTLSTIANHFLLFSKNQALPTLVLCPLLEVLPL